MEKLTKKRESILNIIKEHKTPISAFYIFEKIKASLKINLSTVYRCLKYLEDNNKIVKTNIKNTKYYFIKKPNHEHFVFCIKCDNVETFPCSIEKNTNFEIIEHDFVALGICPSCKDKNS